MNLQIQKIDPGKLNEITVSAGPENAKALRTVFEPYLKTLESWETMASQIVVTEASDESGMKAARDLRLEIKKTRVEVEHKRKASKADALAMSKAVDGIAAVLKLPLERLEAYLQEQEDFAKRAEELRRQELRSGRLAELRSIAGDGYQADTDLAQLGGDTYKDILDGLRRKKAQAEADRIAEENAAAEAEQKRIDEQARMRLENARLRVEAEERERVIADERIEREAAERKAQEQREAAEAEERKRREAEQAETQKRIEAERKARKAAEAELQRKRDEDSREAQRQVDAALALEQGSDKSRLLAYITAVQSVETPSLKTAKCNASMAAFKAALGQLITATK